MTKGPYLGEFEHLVLLALLRLADDAYGMRIRQEIEARTGRPVSIGAVYVTLDRMEDKRYVSSILGEPRPERGGRARRYFRIAPAGARALERTERSLSRMRQGLRIARSEA